ncbi:hypothetical protein CPB85DRAFT_1430511 [Mucidula mucida]|nr:hypothetical protein CPB85DRAFT_1430511 [Mucidula mucida]
MPPYRSAVAPLFALLLDVLRVPSTLKNSHVSSKSQTPSSSFCTRCASQSSSSLDADADFDSDFAEPARKQGVPGSLPFTVATEAPLRESIIIQGQVLNPTIGLNVLWWMLAERVNVFLYRQSGAPGPWTDNVHLRQMYTCNSFRVLDKACQFLIKEVIQKGSQKPREILFRILLYNTFTLPETWILLEKALGPLTWAAYDPAAYRTVLDEARANGVTLFTAAFQKQPGGRGTIMHHHQLSILERMMANDNLLQRLQAPGVYARDIFDYLKTYPSVGDFNAYQLVLNLGYSKLLIFNGDDFSMAKAKTVEGVKDTIEEDIMRWMCDNQEAEFARLGITFTGVNKQLRRLELADFEHAVCEVDKFLRLTHPHLKGSDDRTKSKRSFHGKARPMPPVVLPKVWARRRKMAVRIRPVREEDEPVWVIEKIVERQMVDGIMMYHVFWKGWEEKDMTWEPEYKLVEDIPDMMKRWLKEHGHSQ